MLKLITIGDFGAFPMVICLWDITKFHVYRMK